MDSNFNEGSIKLEGEQTGLVMSRVELIEFLDNLRLNPNILVTYDRDEEEWKSKKNEVDFIKEMHKDYDDVIAFDPYRGQRLAETATVFSNDDYQKNKENDLAVSELKKMFEGNDKVTVFDKSRNRKR